VIRLLFFIVKLALFVAAAVWLANRPGLVTVNWLGYEITTSVGMVLVALLLTVALAISIHSLWRSITGLPHLFSMGHLSRRQQKGYLALTQGLVAVAAGDAQQARKLAYKAEKYLNQPPLTLLLQAQAAQLAGDDNTAARYFNSMLERPELSFLGLRGLITQALKRGDAPHALMLARRAQVLQPKADWVLTALVDLEARAQNWQPASDALAKAMRSGAIGPERGKKLRAVLLVAQSQQSAAASRADEALDQARRAHESLPTFVPAAANYAGLLLAGERAKVAGKIIERCWRSAPHPELGQLYTQAGVGETLAGNVRRLERLAALNPTALDSRLALARAALAAQLWGIARAQLQAAHATGPNASVARLMAELMEKENHDSASARDWLDKAVTAPPEPVWVCSDCQNAAGNWKALCPHCGALGSLEWKAPVLMAATPLALPPASEIKAIAHKG
jgi:HemY protein